MRERVITLLSTGSRNDWRYGLGLSMLGLSAYFLALMHPAGGLNFWMLRLQLLFFAAIIVTLGAVALPTSSRRWWLAKFLVFGAAIHWGVAIPIAYYGYQF